MDQDLRRDSSQPSAKLIVLIPVYDNSSGLKSTLSSLEPDSDVTTVLVVDDGSVEPILLDREYSFSCIVSRIDENKGIESALNKGLSIAEEMGAQYVARIDAGDTHCIGRFSDQIAVLDSKSDVAIVGGGIRGVTADGSTVFEKIPPVSHSSIKREMFLNNCIFHPTVTMRLSCVTAVGGYRLGYPAAEDYDLFFRILRAYKIENIDRVVTNYEVSENQISLRRRRRQLLSRLKIQLENISWFNRYSLLGVARTLFAIFVPVYLYDYIRHR